MRLRDIRLPGVGHMLYGPVASLTRLASGRIEPDSEQPREDIQHPLEPAPDNSQCTTDTDLRAGAFRLFVAYTDSAARSHNRVTVKVRLPADVLAAARSKRTEAKVPGPDGGRPSVAAVLSSLLDTVLTSAHTGELVAAATTDPGPRVGVVNVSVDRASFTLIGACAKMVGVTSPELIARVLTLGLRGQPLAPMPGRRVSPGLLEVSQDFQRQRGTGVHTTHVVLPVDYLTAAKEAARVDGVSRMDMLGRLIGTGLEAADAAPWPVLRALTDPQTVVPAASSKSRVTIPVGVWASVQALAALVSRPTDGVASVLLGLGIGAHSKAGSHA